MTTQSTTATPRCMGMLDEHGQPTCEGQDRAAVIVDGHRGHYCAECRALAVADGLDVRDADPTETRIRVHAERQVDRVFDEGRGWVSTAWMLYNAQGKGRYVATIAGPIALTDLGYGVDGITVTGRDLGRVNLGDALTWARAGQYGLRVVEG